METPVKIQSDTCLLEGLLYRGEGENGVVITHPHPLYGGDMYNSVVESVSTVYRRLGYAVLRFNFRGAGASQGMYDEGIGERNDVKAAVAYLGRIGIRRIDLAGYSFGAWVNARAGCGGIDRMVLVSPPVAFIDFEGVDSLPCLGVVVCGDRDPFAPVDRVRKLARRWNGAARFQAIEGADHFFFGKYLSILGSTLFEMLPHEFS